MNAIIHELAFELRQRYPTHHFSITNNIGGIGGIGDPSRPILTVSDHNKQLYSISIKDYGITILTNRESFRYVAGKWSIGVDFSREHKTYDLNDPECIDNIFIYIAQYIAAQN